MSQEYARFMKEMKYGHLPHRTCTAEAPMDIKDKDDYQWHHPDAIEVGPFFNLITCTCPHCAFTFNCLPR